VGKALRLKPHLLTKETVAGETFERLVRPLRLNGKVYKGQLNFWLIFFGREIGVMD